MDRGLYLAASGMLAEQVRQDQLANDLANASTAGYKADRTTQRSFNQMLLTNSTTGQQIGSVTSAVQVDRTVTDFDPQPAKDTGNPLDFAIVGDGFFRVQTGQGVRYTRDGQFTADADGELATQMGDKVLGRDGKPVKLGADGAVDPRLLDVTLLRNPAKQGDTYVTGTPGAIAGAVAGQVRASALEGSATDPTRSMVDMIKSMRAYESGQKVIQAIDDTLGKAVNQVATVNG